MQYRKLKELNKLENNPRICKWVQFDKLVESIKNNWVIEWRPLLLSNRTWKLVIIWGNQRYEACKKLWIEEVPTYLFEDLTEEKEKEIIIRDNVNNGDWDFDLLANEWEDKDLVEWGIDVNFNSDIEDKDIDFENIESNENREMQTKVQAVCCPQCNYNFNI